MEAVGFRENYWDTGYTGVHVTWCAFLHFQISNNEHVLINMCCFCDDGISGRGKRGGEV